MEAGRRTLVKAVLWQAFGFFSMMLVGLVLTGSVATGGAFAALSTAIGFVSYILYERLWARIGWGRHHG